MSKHSKNLLFLPLLILMLSGCSRGGQETGSVGVAPGTSEAPPVVTEAAVDGIEQVNPLDNYDKNLKCSDLKDHDAELRCEVEVRDVVARAVFAEIRSTFDLDRCKELPSVYLDDCQQSLEMTGVVGPVPSEELELFAEIMRGTAPEPSETAEPVRGQERQYDAGRCAELKTQGYRSYCEHQVQRALDQQKLDEAFLSGDSKSCDSFSDEDLKSQCQDFFGTAPRAPAELPVSDEVQQNAVDAAPPLNTDASEVKDDTPEDGV